MSECWFLFCLPVTWVLFSLCICLQSHMSQKKKRLAAARWQKPSVCLQMSPDYSKDRHLSAAAAAAGCFNGSWESGHSRREGETSLALLVLFWFQSTNRKWICIIPLPYSKDIGWYWIQWTWDPWHCRAWGMRGLCISKRCEQTLQHFGVVNESVIQMRLKMRCSNMWRLLIIFRCFHFFQMELQSGHQAFDV